LTARSRKPLPVSVTLRVAEIARKSSRQAAMLDMSLVLIDERRKSAVNMDGNWREFVARRHLLAPMKGRQRHSAHLFANKYVNVADPLPSSPKAKKMPLSQ
jgi:hypothetical protein